MNVLGIGSPFGHDSSAALLIDGKVVAAAEEERFTRKKHVIDQRPVNSIRYCLEYAHINPEDIDIIAYPWSYQALLDKRREYLYRRLFTNPSKAYKKFFKHKREFNYQRKFVYETIREANLDNKKNNVKWVEHHLAHAASCFYLSGMKKAAVMSIDGAGEATATLLGAGEDNSISKIREIILPDSLGRFYSTMTDYLGFQREDGEYKLMGMAPYGDHREVNFNHIIWWDEAKKSYRCNDDYVWVRRRKRFRVEKVYARRMVEEFGPERKGDGLSEPYIHIAAVTQDKLEEITLRLIEVYLREHLLNCRSLCFSGGCALNVALNRKLLESSLIDKLWVQPASNDAGTSLGAAAYAAAMHGEKIQPMEHVYLGPEFNNQEIEGALKESGFNFEYLSNITERVAELLSSGEIVAWFQGRMEWGPRALGNRSILGNPSIKGTADRINATIKFREKWRPFCPSILKEFAYQILGSDHPAPFMTIAFKVVSSWQQRIPEVVHVDGTCRPQVVERETNPKFYSVIENFYQKTGIPLVINTSLNRRAEPIACRPEDALLMLEGSGLRYLAIGDFLVTK